MIFLNSSTFSFCIQISSAFLSFLLPQSVPNENKYSSSLASFLFGQSMRDNNSIKQFCSKLLSFESIHEQQTKKSTRVFRSSLIKFGKFLNHFAFTHESSHALENFLCRLSNIFFYFISINIIMMMLVDVVVVYIQLLCRHIGWWRQIFYEIVSGGYNNGIIRNVQKYGNLKRYCDFRREICFHNSKSSHFYSPSSSSSLITELSVYMRERYECRV